MEFIKTIWNLTVLTITISYFGGLAGLTYKIGVSALNLQKRGMVSLSKYNRALVGGESLGNLGSQAP